MNSYKRFRIIETRIKRKSTFIIQWNDMVFFGLFGFWHDKHSCNTLKECENIIDRIIRYNIKI
jgi:G:T-mismatch repair DNA endonuclease (very short patch repair protein)